MILENTVAYGSIILKVICITGIAYVIFVDSKVCQTVIVVKCYLPLKIIMS